MKAIINGTLVFPDRITDGIVLIEGDRIVASGNANIPAGAEIIDATGLYVGPGFVDQHSHGYQHCGESIPVKVDPQAAAMAHLKHGVTTYIPSTDYSDTLEDHEKVIQLCVETLNSGVDTPIMGIHLEGPYINRLFGSNSLGAMDYDDDVCEKLFEMASPYVRHCTYAPELSTAPRLEAKMRKYGITGAIGHTNAGPVDIERAVAYGARIATHLFDASGCDRSFEDAAKLTQHPQNCTANILLGIPGMYYELICDSAQMHTTKYSVCEALRAGGEDYVVLISDAFVETAEQKEENDVNFDVTGCLSGSRLCLPEAIRNFIKFTGVDMKTAFKCAATNSAKALGLFDTIGSIDAGKLANVVLVDPSFHVKKVFFKGQEVTEIRD